MEENLRLFGDNLLDWIALTEPSQLDQIKTIDIPVIIYKHSTKCHISTFVLKNLEKEYFEKEPIAFYFLDILTYRTLSNLVAETFRVHHESPQILLIKNGECIFDESHQSIDITEITEEAFKN